MKKKLLVLFAAVVCLAFAGVLAGCSSSGSSAASSSSSDSASANRSYMSSANTIIGQLQDNLTDFSDAVAKDDLVTMQATAKTAGENIDAFKKLTPPDQLKSVHEQYTKGCDQLKQALDDYISLYADRKKSNISDSEFSSRLSTIQSEYDAGIAALQEGDKQATALK